jgi:hypothetical protein
VSPYPSQGVSTRVLFRMTPLPRGSIVVMHMHGKEPLSLARSERTDLFVYVCSYSPGVMSSLGLSDNGLFEEDAYTHRDHSCGNESFSSPL